MSRLDSPRYAALCRVWTVARLTIRSALGYRLVSTVLMILAGLLLGLPVLIKHNGTAEMLTQVVLSYSLNLIILFLGLITVWLSCSALAKEIREGQMQMVAVKPITRWQIWLGKWLGITVINTVLLLLSGIAVLGLLYSGSTHLSQDQRQVLREKVLVARGALSEPAPDLSAEVERIFQERLQRDQVADLDRDYVREKIEEEVWALNQIVTPNHLRRWEIDFGWRHRLVDDTPLHLRIKFYAAQVAESAHYPTLWIVGDPNTGMFWRQELDLSPASFHEIAIPPGLISSDGILRIECRNYTAASLIFPVDEDLEVLFPEGTFVLNFARSLAVILLWLALLTALGLAAASILSFPVATFLVFGLLAVVFSGNLLTSIVTEKTVSAIDEHTGQATWTQLDWLLVPAFQAVLDVVETLQSVSPIESLANGRTISVEALAQLFLKLALMMGVPVAGVGMFLFHRNELATSGKNA